MAAGNNNIAKTVEIVKMSDYNNRLNRGLVLENGLTALLISDPDAKKSSVSLTIPVGSLCVPNDMAGIATLCDHLLYLGTQKYPIAHSFEGFLSRNGGSSFTSIGNDFINYNFSVQANALIQGLDRFSQFFIAPLFTQSANREHIMKAMFLHDKNINSDSKRIGQMIKNGVDPNHPLYQNYITGSKYTLVDRPLLNNISIFEEVVKFISKWYSSNLMYLTILGKDDLNVLEQHTLSYFGQIKKKNIDMPRWCGTIYNTEQLATKTMVVPLRDIYELYVIFPIPDQSENYKSKPIWFLSKIFEHEGPNSILGILKKKGWCYELFASWHQEARGINFFQIIIRLTKKGFNYVDDIMKLIFQLVNMLKCKKLPIRFYEEYGNMFKLKFDFNQNSSPVKYTSKLSISLATIPLKDIIKATHEIHSWRPDLIRELASYLRPDNMRITVVSKIFENITNTVDSFFGTSYKTIKIPIETLEMWQENDVCPDLTLPPSNKFITSVERLVDISGNEPHHPIMYYESVRLRCWLKKDTVFRLPQTFISIMFFCDSISTEVDEFTVKYLFLKLFQTDFASCVKDALNANLRLSMKSAYNGINVDIEGGCGKLHIFLQQFIDKLTTYKIDPMRFTLNKENIVKKFGDNEDTLAFNNIKDHKNLLLNQLRTPKQINDAVNNITFEQMEEFTKTFQTHARMEMLLYGNVDNKKANQLVKILEKPFLNHATIYNLPPLMNWNETDLGFEGNSRSIHKNVSFDYLSSSSAHLMFYCGDYSPKKAVIIKLFNAVTRLYLWNQTRTELYPQFQHKFVMFSNCFTCCNALFLTYAVQSSEHDPPSMTMIIEKNIERFWKWCWFITNDRFDTWKIILEAQLLKSVGSMNEQMDIFKHEFTNRTFDFNRTQIEVEALRSATKKDLFRFYRKYMKLTGLKRCTYKINVQPSTRHIQI